ncbi:MAG: acyl-CoA dehydrogenase family protein [Propionibacteriales bacterium]|nr:acyl-CoA dehydrogenase family protein [Propionibacteriales bacterium]
MTAHDRPAAGAFGLTPDQHNLLKEADDYARKEFGPIAARMDDEEWWPPELMSNFGKHGMLGATIGPEYGGAGMSYLEAGLVLQAFARWSPAIALSWAAHDNLCANNLYTNGSDDIRSRFLPKLVSGEWVGCLGLTEPGAGSDALGSMRTKAVRDGDVYRISGSKIYITNGPIADVCLLYAKTQPDRGSKGITAFVVETSTPGFQVAQKLNKMGFRGSQTAELVFDDMVVPVENIVGTEHEGHQVVMSGLDIERAMIAPISVGTAERALALSIEYAKSREQFGAPIASFQMVQSRIAEMYADIEAAKTLCWSVLSACDAVDEREAGRGEIHARTASAVMFCADMANRVLNHALQIHGGGGYIWETEINRLYRSIKLLEIGAGTTEVRKLIIAGELLR